LRSSAVMSDRDRFRGAPRSSLDVGAGRDFAAGLEVVVDGRDDVEDAGVPEGDGEGRARSEELTVAIGYDMYVAEMGKCRGKREAL